MDFFAAEGRAKQKTTRLLVLFTLAVVATVIGGYLLALFGLHFAHAAQATRRGYYPQDDVGRVSLWDPALFLVVTAGTLGVVGLASLYKWTTLHSGGAAVAESVGGRRVDPHTTDLKERQLLNVVEEMAIASGLPVPAVYIMDDEGAINAFAAGLTTNDAVVTVTRGTLERLNRDELQGVVGHEFSHILNGDMRLNLRVTAVIFGILVLGLAGRGILSTLQYGRWGGSSNDRDNKNGGGVMLVIGAGLALMVVGYVGYFFGRLIQASVSRQREFLADASSVQFTRNPAGIGNALRKIGGLAIGSKMATHRATEISHFFFAQAFPSFFGGLWATHPPLPARIRAIDPTFDGRMIEPETAEPETVAPAAPAAPPPLAPLRDGPALGAALLAGAGTLTAAATSGAQALLADLPGSLRTAVRSPHDAPIVVYGLLLDGENEAVRRQQLALLAAREGADVLHTLEQLDPALRALGHEQRLPVLQLTLPALKQLPPTALGTFTGSLDALIQADGQVTIWEYALQRIVRRNLAVSRAPTAAATQVFAFPAVARELSVVLSALAHASSADDTEAAKAFAVGAAQLPLVQAQLAFLPAASTSLADLDAALGRLAVASGPIKQRLLVAGAHVAGADGVLLEQEVELLRAVAAALDVPVPPLITG